MLEHLFGSRTRVKLLRLFFSEPNRAFFVRELTRLLDSQINAVRREILHLTNSGIIIETTTDAPVDDAHEAKRKYYRLNESSVIFPELRALLLKSHVLGEQSLAAALAASTEVQLLLFTGMFTNANTPIDMLVVGSIADKRVAKLVADFEHEYGSAVRYTLLTARDYLERKQLMDRFIYEVLDAPHELAVNRLPKV